MAGRLSEMLKSGQAPHAKGMRILTTNEQTMKTMAAMEQRGDFNRMGPREKNLYKKVWTADSPKAPKTAAGYL